MRIAIYARISRDADGEGLGVTRQVDDCTTLAEHNGWVIVDTYVDNDISAFSGKRRVRYEQMLADLRLGRFDAVLAWHPDRLHRHPRELEDFIDALEEAGATVKTVTAGSYDLSTPDGRLTARITGSVARKESEDKSRRARRKHDELAEAGKVSGGGPRPFGFESDRITVNEAEAELVRDAATRVLAGQSLYSIAKNWTERGIPTSTGSAWSTSSLKAFLTSPRIAGLRVHHGEVVGQAQWDAILDEATWRLVVAAINARSRRREHPNRTYLLTGLIFCAKCGQRLHAAPRSSKQGRVSAYGCVGKNVDACGGVNVLAEPVENLVSAMVLEAIRSPELGRRLAAPDEGPRSDVEVALADLANAEAAQSELARLWADGELSSNEWASARSTLAARVDAARLAIADQGYGEPSLNPGELAELGERWEEMSIQERRHVIAVVVDRVEVSPSSRQRNRFDPDRIGVIWKL